MSLTRKDGTPIMAWRRADRRPVGRMRSAAAIAALVGHLFSAVGLPLPGPSAIPAASPLLYPCQGHSCGCRSYDECWAGDCCCFTLREKVAWARANGIEPPAHAVRAVDEPAPDRCAEDEAAGCPCCAK